MKSKAEANEEQGLPSAVPHACREGRSADMAPVWPAGRLCLPLHSPLPPSIHSP
jgi:hypothetical protein